MAIIENRLKEAMEKAGITQSELAIAAGVSKSAISQYLSGKNEPKHSTIERFAEILGVDEAWLDGHVDLPTGESKKKITTYDVAKALGIGVEAVRIGLQHGNFPFGCAIKTSETRFTYSIYPKKFFEYCSLK